MGMKEVLGIREMIAYQKGQLSPEEAANIENFLVENPEYVKIMKGLSVLKTDLPAPEEPEQFLQERKEVLRGRIFSNLGGRR